MRVHSIRSSKGAAACSTLFPTWPNKKGKHYACLKRDFFSTRFYYYFFLPHHSWRAFIRIFFSHHQLPSANGRARFAGKKCAGSYARGVIFCRTDASSAEKNVYEKRTGSRRWRGWREIWGWEKKVVALRVCVCVCVDARWQWDIS